MKTDITRLHEGTSFKFEGQSFMVTSREEYPFILARCMDDNNQYGGIEVLFANFEQVEVPDCTPLYKAIGVIISC